MSPAVCKVNVCCLLARSKLFASTEHQTFTTAEPVLQGGVAENDLHPPAASMVGLASRLGAFAEHSRMVMGVDAASDAMGSAMETQLRRAQTLVWTPGPAPALWGTREPPL